MDSRKFPAFFKPFIAKDRERRMVIPLHFSQFMEGRMPSSGFLRDRHNKLWHVKIAQMGDGYCFEGGWPKFVKEKKLQFRDCLTFEYNGNYTFDVKVFGQDACEKDFDVEARKSKGKEEDEEEIEVTEEDEDEEIEEVEETESEESSDSQSVGVELWEMRKRKPNYKRRRSTGWKGKGKSKRVGEDSEDDNQTVFDLGIIDRPKNAYFVTKLNPKRKSDLRVPTYVIKDFNLELPEEMRICDENGRKWRTIVKEWNDGRTYLTKGWRPFCLWNNVEENDLCICEFVPGNGGSKIRLQIRIVRASAWLPRI